MEDEVEYEKRRSKRNRKRCLIGIAIFLVLLLIITIIVVVTLVVVPSLHTENEVSFRLPTSVVPEQYALEIQPYLTSDNFTFDGSVNITVTCAHSTDNITLHASDLTIHEVIVHKGSVNVPVKKWELFPKYELLVLSLKHHLSPGKMYEIYIKFSGKLGTSEGFYMRSYKEHNTEKYIAATKFEPTYARRAFPCFDEPSYKSTFLITIIRQDNEFSSLSCGGSKSSTKREDGWIADSYAASPTQMSPYLVAFFIGERMTTRVIKSNVTVVSRSASITDSEYALEIAANASDFYFSTFGTLFSPRKLDLVAIPDEHSADFTKNRFNTTGMESAGWQLIMLDESSMLSLPRDEEWEKQEVARIVSRQVARQLFRNLMTPKWWTDLWLSESLATYVAAFALDERINRHWRMVDHLKRPQFSRFGAVDYMEYDCSESSQPLSVDIDDPSDIQKLYNPAIYNKGARLIALVHYLIKDKLFWEGLRIISGINNEQYKAAEYSKFWKVLNQEQQKMDFEVITRTWIKNRGYPIVTLNRDYRAKTGVLTQKSCLNESSLWEIPVLYVNKSSSQQTLWWLNTTTKTVTTMPGKNRWVLLNGYLNGYFHVNYDKENWELLAKQLKSDSQVFPPATRYQLLYDAFMLAKMNITSYTVLFDLLLYMENEQDKSVIEILALAKLSEIWKALRMSNLASKWKDFVYTVMARAKNHFSSEKQQTLPVMHLKREFAIGLCYFVNNQICIDDAESEAKRWFGQSEPFKDMSTLDQYLMRPYLCTAVRKDAYYGIEIHKILTNEALNWSEQWNGTKMEDMIYALGCSVDADQTPVYLATYISHDGNPTPLIEGMLNFKDTSERLFDYLNNQLYQLDDRYDRLELVVKALSEAVANPGELKKMEEVFSNFIKKVKEHAGKYNEKKEEERKKLFDKHVKQATKRLELVEYQLPPMVAWLRDYKPV